MAIPEAQLSTWANHPSTKVASATYEVMKDVIRERDDLGLRGSELDIYLQGSYKNFTNTYQDHDVDIVVELRSCATTDYSLVPPNVARVDAASRPVATFNALNLHYLVYTALSERFGPTNVQAGSKAIKVVGVAGIRMSSDILVCQSHRLLSWSQLSGIDEQPGISFYERPSGRLIVNYPYQHWCNGVSKHKRTGDRFKPTVRILKNARRRMIDNGRLPQGTAPSYFLQGLLYNVDDSAFRGSAIDTFQAVVRWLLDHADAMGAFSCQNGLVPLFGHSSEQWDVRQAVEFIVALSKFDREWM